MRIVQIATRENSFFFTNFSFCINQFDAPAATGSDWFQDVKCILIFITFPIELKGFVFLRKTVAHRRDVEFFGKFHSESVYIAPKKVFPAQLGTVREVVDLLVLVHIFDVRRGYVSGPLQVIKLIIRLNHREARMLC